MYNKPLELELNARKIASAAIRRGELIPRPCIECGDPNVIAHHDDYNEPLRVTWLCRKHHIAEHKLLILMARRRLAADLVAIKATLPPMPPPKLIPSSGGPTD
jgi:ribosomal protein S27AE